MLMGTKPAFASLSQGTTGYKMRPCTPLDKPHEECGVFGISAHDVDVVAAAYHALYALQHRGQESCGIAVNHNGVIHGHKDTGLVNEVFTPTVLERLDKGEMAIGHCRYAGRSLKRRSNAQPLLVNHLKGAIALAHNGSLTNAAELRDQLELNGAIFHTSSDIEIIAYIVTQERLTAASIEEALRRAMDRLQGAYSMVLMSPQKLIAVRDPLGVRPLCIGRLGDGYVFASESCALDSIGATFMRDVIPGEIVVVSGNELTSIPPEKTCKGSLCVFEYIYFARPDSVIDGTSVHAARLKAGALLAINNPAQADVVIGVPDSGIDAAIGYARQSGIPYGMGFIKNRYIGRTFIQPEQSQRAKAVRIKLNPVAETVRGKRVVLVDDSIVRGTTSGRIVKLLREAGAKEVHLRLSSPPFLYPCYYGTDVDSQECLIAFKHTIDEICQIVGADSIGFLNPADLPKLQVNACGSFCNACFTGEYPIAPPKRSGTSRFDHQIGEGEA